MKLHYMGKYNMDPESIPTKPHRPNCVKFKEPENSEELSKIASTISLVVLVICCIPLAFYDLRGLFSNLIIATLIMWLTLFPHEIIHALCFTEDVYLFTNLKQGMLFVAGPEDMSKARFVFMSLLPSIVFGLIPYVVFFFNPSLILLGVCGAVNLSCGGGDYLNVYNAITQMPKGARTYLYKFSSYWYIPEK